MLKINTEDQQYILPLDNLDLIFMSRYLEKPVLEKKVSWSKFDVDGESAYHQINLVCENTQNDDSYVEESTVNREESRCLMKAKPDDHVFYCETCCKAVLVEHKQEHNQTNYHLKYLERATLANSFLEMYSTSSLIDNTFIDDELINEDNIENRINNVHIVNKKYAETTFCDVCNRNIHTHNFLAHTKSRKHLALAKRKNHKTCTGGLNFEKDASGLLINRIPINNKMSKKTLCTLCNRNIDTNNFVAHTKSWNHIKAKLDNSIPLDDEDKAVIDKNNKTYCELCKVHIPKYGFYIHEKGTSHRFCVDFIS